MQQDGAQRPLDLRTLFDAGVHFGHPSKRWNPKMDDYIFTKRARSHIIDLSKTVKATEEAKAFVSGVVARGGKVLMVGTKKQAQQAIHDEGERSGTWYINQRWLGGMLTNFQTIQTRIERLVYLEDAIAKGTVETQTKREALRLQTEVNRLNSFFGGIKEMDKLPDALFIVDTEKEDIAVKEARRLKIPIVAMVDTNCDPDDADYAIPANDDAVRAVALITAHIADAIIAGGETYRTQLETRMAEEAELEAQEAIARAAAQAAAAERASAAAAAARSRRKADAAPADGSTKAASTTASMETAAPEIVAAAPPEEQVTEAVNSTEETKAEKKPARSRSSRSSAGKTAKTEDQDGGAAEPEAKVEAAAESEPDTVSQEAPTTEAPETETPDTEEPETEEKTE